MLHEINIKPIRKKVYLNIKRIGQNNHSVYSACSATPGSWKKQTSMVPDHSYTASWSTSGDITVTTEFDSKVNNNNELRLIKLLVLYDIVLIFKAYTLIKAVS